MLRHDCRQLQLYGEHLLLYDIMRQDGHVWQLQTQEELPAEGFSGQWRLSLNV